MSVSRLSICGFITSLAVLYGASQPTFAVSWSDNFNDGNAEDGNPVTWTYNEVGFTPGIIDAVLARLEQGAKRSGRRLEDLEIVWAVRTGTASTTAEAQRLARPTAVHWGILSWGNHWLPHAGLQIPAFEIPQEVLDIYPDLGHAHNWEEAIAATSFVPDDVVAQLCDALGLIGTPEYCAQRIMDMTKVGVTNLYLMPLQTFVGPKQEIRAFRDVVFPRLRTEGYL